MFRQFRRAPGRIIASIFALALAVGAIGVLAIPRISEGSLHAAVADDGLGDIVVATSPLDRTQVASIARISGVVAAEGEIDVAARLDDGTSVRVVGLDPERSMDLLHLVDGRMPSGSGEVLASTSTAPIGTTATIGGRSVTVVGHASTLWWSDAEAVYTDIRSAAALAPEHGINRLVITASDDSEASLHAIVDAVRARLAGSGATLTEFPVYLPDGTTPIDADIRQVSTLIGMLGIVAGIVAMVLLASTTNTLITERTREVAVMRSLGGRQRPLRRRLRRIALGITAIALVVGIPFGIVVSNLIARMVLEKFVGITPAVTVDWRVIVGSVAGMLLGARLVAARAARRVTKLDLAEALRDRDGAPFGRTWPQRLLSRIATGGLLGRIALRSSTRRPGRTVAVVAQIATAVGAAFLIASLAASVNDFNAATYAPWQWESQTMASDPGLPFAQTMTDVYPGTESGIYVFGEVAGLEVDVYGMSPDTGMFDPRISAGRWIEPARHEAVVSKGFAERRQIIVGETVELELAAGVVDYRVVGLADDSARAIYLDRTDLAADAGATGMANVVWAGSPSPSLGSGLTVEVDATTHAELVADAAAGRDAIVVIFGAIGVIVAGVAALAVVSSMMISLYERRHEFAALQAIGARRRRLRGLLFRELVPLGLVGLVAGLALGMLATRAIIASFEASNAVDIGTSMAFGSIPIIAASTFAVLALMAAGVVRGASRRPVAVTLRGAA
jgi:putative ABC transport system permease protein